MARGLWKGAISFGLVNVPVELFPAEKRSSELDLTMLDRRDLAPVGYKRVNKATGEDVPWSQIVKGYEYRDGKYVVLSAEDFRKANVEASRTVEILAFVDREQIPPQFFASPYYLVPGKRGEKAYALLRDALKKSGKAGVATTVIRTRQYLALVLPQEDYLLMNTLRYADELRDFEALGVPRAALKDAKASAKEIDMALRLIDDMAEDWNPDQYRDTYREDLLKRIEAKVQAGETRDITAPERRGDKESAEVIDLMTLLKKSVEKTAARPKRARKRRAA